jgi:ribosomal protein L22
MLARQIRGLPLSEAIAQMTFSPRRAAVKIRHNLAFAQKNALLQKGMKSEDLVVAQAWVGKGQYSKRIKIHGRGRMGVMHRKQAHMKYILQEKSTQETERRNIRGWNEHKRVPVPLVEKPIYNPKPYYNW